MFETLDTIRRREEAVIWRREQNRGKGPFLLRSTLVIASVLALLDHPLLHLHVPPGTSHRTPILILSYALCLMFGYLLSLLAWRRGRRLTTAASGEPHA